MPSAAGVMGHFKKAGLSLYFGGFDGNLYGTAALTRGCCLMGWIASCS